MISEDIKYIKSISKESLLLNESMAKHTTFGVGGVADCYIMPKDISQLKKIKTVD